MSFPNIPNITPTISISTAQTIPLLLSSIALEELALAHIINAEAEKLQFVLGTLPPGRTTLSPPVVTVSNLLTVDSSVQRTLRDVIKKEMLLEFKFENVLDLLATLPTSPPSPPCTPTTSTFSNPASIAIPDQGNASPYPSIINVTGLTGTISKVTVTLDNISHTFPADIDILLVGPGGQNVILMSDVDGGLAINNVTLTFDDDAPEFLPDVGQIVSGTFKPTNYGDDDTFTAPAPAPPYGSLLNVFNGTNPNGTWNLFVTDQFSPDSGIITGGWSLTITTTCP